MSFSNASETDLLNYIAFNTPPSWAGNTNFWVAAHTSDPGDPGTAVTSEVSYGGYARVAVVRATGFSVSGNQMTNTGLIQLPISSSAGADITHISLVTTASGAGTIIQRYSLTAALPTSVGVQPQFAPSSIVFTLD